MSFHAPRICSCGKTVQAGDKCACQQSADRARKARFDRTRPSARARGYTAEWERESKAFLALPQNRLCACGCGRLANMVDHRIPHRGDQKLFWDRANWQPMNGICHSRNKQRHERNTTP
jgi:5-methylcytosine-specific restriction protein A